MNHAPSEPRDVISAVEQGVLFVTLNRPRARNALSLGVLAQIREIFTAAAKADDLHLAVLTGAGDKAFASGGDLHELDALRSHAEAVTLSEHGRSALNAIRNCPVPVVGVLNGLALGGGAELALACDLRIAAPHATLGFIHSRLAISPSWGGGTDLMRIVGCPIGLKLLLSGEILTASHAFELGLVDQVAPGEGNFSEEVRAFLDTLKQKPQVARAAKAISSTVRSVQSAALQAVETTHFAEVWSHSDHWAAVAGLSIGAKRHAS